MSDKEALCDELLGIMRPILLAEYDGTKARLATALTALVSIGFLNNGEAGKALEEYDRRLADGEASKEMPALLLSRTLAMYADRDATSCVIVTGTPKGKELQTHVFATARGDVGIDQCLKILSSATVHVAKKSGRFVGIEETLTAMAAAMASEEVKDGTKH